MPVVTFTSRSCSPKVVGLSDCRSYRVVAAPTECYALCDYAAGLVILPAPREHHGERLQYGRHRRGEEALRLHSAMPRHIDRGLRRCEQSYRSPRPPEPGVRPALTLTQVQIDQQARRMRAAFPLISTS
jgi:hypothetical protein